MLASALNGLNGNTAGGTVFASGVCRVCNPAQPKVEHRESVMPYLSGVLTGIILTIVVVFLIDHVGDEPESRDIVNWDYVGGELGQSAGKVADEVREEVHKATAPAPAEAPAAAPMAAPEPAPEPASEAMPETAPATPPATTDTP